MVARSTGRRVFETQRLRERGGSQSSRRGRLGGGGLGGRGIFRNCQTSRGSGQLHQARNFYNGSLMFEYFDREFSPIFANRPG